MKKTIIICATVIVCTVVVCISLCVISASNRYASFSGFSIPSILDRKTGVVYSANTNSDDNKIYWIITDIINHQRLIDSSIDSYRKNTSSSEYQYNSFNSTNSSKLVTPDIVKNKMDNSEK